MAVSTQVFNKELVAKLDVIPAFNDLMKAAVGKDSLYLKTKDTLKGIFEDGNLTSAEKSKIVADVMSNIAVGMTNTAMQMAFTLSKENRDAPYELAKLVEEVKLTKEQRDKMAGDVKLVDQQIENMKADTVNKRIGGWKIQADIFTKNGINVTTQNVNTPVLSSVANSNHMALDLLQAEQTKAANFSTLASTFRREGTFTWTTNAKGDINAATALNPTWDLLTPAQTAVAIRQEQGFDDNMRQHAANSSANMIGLLLSSGNYDVLTQADVDRWRTAVNYLNTP